MRVKIAGITLALILIAATLGASAFTSGTVDRSANVNVVNDNAGLIGLEDGTSGGLVYMNTSGALEIDFAQGGATGANTEARYELGNPADAANHSAFNITNNDAASHDLTVSYTGSAAGDTDNNIQFQIYDGTGSSVATVSEESTSTTINGVASGTTYHVVIVVDTHGVSSGTDLSGTLTVSA